MSCTPHDVKMSHRIKNFEKYRPANSERYMTWDKCEEFWSLHFSCLFLMLLLLLFRQKGKFYLTTLSVTII